MLSLYRYCSNQQSDTLKGAYYSHKQQRLSPARASHRHRKVLNIGGGGAKVQNIGGGGGGKLFAGCKLIGAPAPNQCQIITFLTLKIDNIAKLRIELKSILSEIHKIK